MTEPLEIPINPNIVRMVALLQENGFKTCDSGDGKTHAAACDRDYGYVSMIADPEILIAESERLVRVLDAAGVKVHQMNSDELPCTQASYDPVSGTAIIDLMFVTDDLLPPE
jgi:hypothetical protein